MKTRERQCLSPASSNLRASTGLSPPPPPSPASRPPKAAAPAAGGSAAAPCCQGMETRGGEVDALCRTAASRRHSGSSAAAAGDGTKITYNTIKAKLGPLLYKLSSQKFEDPAEGEEVITAKLKAVYDELVDRFRALEEEFR